MSRTGIRNVPRADARSWCLLVRISGYISAGSFRARVRQGPIRHNAESNHGVPPKPGWPSTAGIPDEIQHLPERRRASSTPSRRRGRDFMVQPSAERAGVQIQDT